MKKKIFTSTLDMHIYVYFWFCVCRCVCVRHMPSPNVSGKYMTEHVQKIMPGPCENLWRAARPRLSRKSLDIYTHKHTERKTNAGSRIDADGWNIQMLRAPTWKEVPG